MKVLVVPDVHGSLCWKRIKNIPKESYDYAVFLGDYVDSWENRWSEQGDNIKEIFDWIREDTEHRKCLIGNHDFSYISSSRDGNKVSGHQYDKALEIRKIFEDNYDVLDLAAEFDGWVFSHAGFTKTWVASLLHHLHQELDKWPDEFYERHMFQTKEESDDFLKRMGDGLLVWDENEFSIDFLNGYWHKRSHNPGGKNTRLAFDELLDWNGYFSGSGDEITQGPLWVRPHSLLKDAYYPKQVVGHTEMCFGEPVGLSFRNKKVVVVDSTEHDLIYIFDTENPCDFITEAEHNKLDKRMYQTLNVLLSTKIRDEDVIKNELLAKGAKETQLKAYINLLKSYWKD